MNTNDKNYVDRLHNQQVNELNEIKNRLLILEGKTTATTDGNIRVEIDTDKIYEMFLKACHDCLQQRQERHPEEDRKAEERLRQEREAKGEPYYSTEAEMRIAIIKEFNTFYRLIIISEYPLLQMIRANRIRFSQTYRLAYSPKSPHFAIASQVASAITSLAASHYLAAGRF